MAELVIPIQAVNEANYRRIDELAVFDQLESQFRKFFSKESGVKALRKVIAEEIESDEIMVRIETATNKQFSHFAAQPDFVERYAAENKDKYCLHEVIHGDKCKLFFDIDKARLDIRDFDLEVKKFLANNQIDVEISMAPIVSERVDTTKKFSYHITYPVVMPISLVERIATRLQKKFPAIDLQVYKNKTLRINGSYKFENKEIDRTSLITSSGRFADTLISYTYGYPEVDEPMVLSKTNILNFNLETSRLTVEGEMPKEYHDIMIKLIPDDETKDQWFKVASVKLG